MELTRNRDSWKWLRIACTIAVLCLASNADGRQPDAAPVPPAVQVRVTTVTTFAVPLVGQTVRVIDGTVRRVISPRLFILSGSGPGVPLSHSQELAVIVETGTAMVSADEQVMVTGVVHGFVSGQEDIGRRLIGALKMDERLAVGKRPLVVINSATSLARR
jgi:hypothetical protein